MTERTIDPAEDEAPAAASGPDGEPDAAEDVADAAIEALDVDESDAPPAAARESVPDLDTAPLDDTRLNDEATAPDEPAVDERIDAPQSVPQAAPGESEVAPDGPRWRRRVPGDVRHRAADLERLDVECRSARRGSGDGRCGGARCGGRGPGR